MSFSPLQIGILAGLFITFLLVPTISQKLGSFLDSLPIRFAAVLIILAVIPYDPYVSLGVFLVIASLYIQRHQNELKSVSSVNDLSAVFSQPSIVSKLETGGHTEMVHDEMDFIPKDDIQETEYTSIDMKHVIQTEQSRAHNLFQEDADRADFLMTSNRDGTLKI